MKFLKCIKTIPRLLFNILFIPIYHLFGLFPRNQKLWLFSSWFGQKYSDNTRVFFEYILKNRPEIKAVWITRSKEVLNLLREKRIRVYSAYSIQFLILSIRAGKLFTTNGNEFFFGFCKNAEHYSLWHGMPLKKILKSDTFSGKARDRSFIYRFYSFFYEKLFKWLRGSLFGENKLKTLSSASFFTPFLLSAFAINSSQVIPIGLPRIDALFFGKEEKLIVGLKKKYKNCKIILYMPTFRTGAWTKIPFNPFSKNYCFDEEKFTNLLEMKNLVFIYKPHYVDLQLTDNFRKNGRFITINDDDYEELYNFVGQTDVLITDYSSIYFDFIVTRKPVILAPFDMNDYLKSSRDFYFDYNQMEGVKCMNWNDLINVLRQDKFYTLSEKSIKKFSEYFDGNNCKKLLSYIMENY